MDTRTLYIIAAIVLIVSSLYYHLSGKRADAEQKVQQDFSQNAKDIRWVETDVQGRLLLDASAKSSQQWVQQERATFDDLTALAYIDGEAAARFTAKKLDSLRDNEQVNLAGNVVFERLDPEKNVLMTLTTDHLIGFPKQKTIETDAQVTITSPSSHLVSQGLEANIEQGIYQFSHIRGQYAAPH